jgi:hypothetical protein
MNVVFLRIDSNWNMNLRVLAGSKTLIATGDSSILIHSHVRGLPINQEDLGTVELDFVNL